MIPHMQVNAVDAGGGSAAALVLGTKEARRAVVGASVRWLRSARGGSRRR
jgi:hypothetical protein